ncbi:ABC transporter substrate-binding protein [Acidothermaceae bacterium B102]|nr:ABC transporter substrate-binding protein [Acidothermaceae bacterium B102]
MPNQLTVAIVAPVFNNMPVWAAQELGWFGEAGLAVTANVLYGVQNVTTAVVDGSADIGIGTPEGVLSDPDATLVMVGGNAGKLANALITRREITSVEGLRGRTIGVSHAREGTALLAREMLATHGLQPGDYEIKAMGVASARWEAIQAGELDAGLQTAPHKYLAEDAGYPNLGDISDYVPDYQFTSFNVRRDWLPSRADPLRRFLAVVAKATQWLYDQPTDAVRVAEIVMKTTPEYAQRDYDHFRQHRSLDPTLQLSPAGMAKVIEVMTTAGTLVPGTVWQDRTDLSYLPAPTTTEGAPA